MLGMRGKIFTEPRHSMHKIRVLSASAKVDEMIIDIISIIRMTIEASISNHTLLIYYIMLSELPQSMTLRN